MRLTDQQLIGLPVVTASGDPIGKVVGLEIDVDRHTIATYLVGAAPLVIRLVGLRVATLRVDPSQVVGVDAEQMTVADNTVQSVAPKTAAI